jgi:hypothetical protein
VECDLRVAPGWIEHSTGTKVSYCENAIHDGGDNVRITKRRSDKRMPTSIDPQPEEDELECARCGAHFYYGLTRCPNCGVNLYEPEDENEESEDDSCWD